jgi:hypothetical protein
MAEINPTFEAPVFGTIGPEGTDHERVTRRYIDFQGLLSAEVQLMLDPIKDGPDWVLEASNRFLILCDAHPKIHMVNERYPQEMVVIDNFIDATKHLSLIYRKDAPELKTIGLVEATRGYIPDLAEREEKGDKIVDVQSKPVLSQMLLEGECDAGITHTSLVDEHPDLLRVEKSYGKVNTTWTVFGQAVRSPYHGELVGHKIPWVFTGEQPPQD